MNRLAFGLFLILLPAFASAQSPSGIDLNALDKAADPCNNFYQYACGGWLKANPIPPEEASWGRFDVLQENNQKTLRAILEDAAAHPASSPVAQQVGGFYQSCTNEDAIETLGGKPLRAELEHIAAIDTRADLVPEIARLHALQVQVFFNFGATPDPDDAHHNMANLDQGGLGLPERDFYFRSDARSAEIRQQYVTHIGKMLALSGIDPPLATKQAVDIMRIETALAKASLDVTARRDPKLLIHRTSVADLEAQSPAFSFDQYFKAIAAPKFASVNVSVPSFEKELNELLANEPLAELKQYLVWHYVSASGRLAFSCLCR